MSTTPVLLQVKDVSLTFGGVTALDSVTFDVGDDELLAVIGPNGAGKTSVFNCLNGIYRPEHGSIKFADTEIVGLRPPEIARLGVARTFQNLALFSNLDVVDNLMLGRHRLMRTGLLAASAWLGRARREELTNRERCGSLLELLDLTEHEGRPVGSLPYGVQKRVELGRALAMDARLLLLDEPVAGMNSEETEQMAHIILRIQDEMRIAILLVEHDMHFVMDLADRVVALDFGHQLTAGSPEEVAAHPDVVAAYLGAS